MAKKKKTPAPPPPRFRLRVPPEVIQLIVDQLSIDFGNSYTTSYPRHFLDLAFVSTSFAAAVQLCIYEHLKVNGRDRFLYLTGQLRVSPQLGALVRHAYLRGTCLHTARSKARWAPPPPTSTRMKPS
ncbi:hypothetical protein P7C70_g6327, partial [Phenoliferia sp. Uapishka_3]